MIRYVAPPDCRAGPVTVLGLSGDSIRVRSGGERFQIARKGLSRAFLWVGRGNDWRGPYRHWRGVLGGLADLEGLEAAAELSRGRASELGATAMVGTWTYRLAWGGLDPPLRFSN